MVPKVPELSCSLLSACFEFLTDLGYNHTLSIIAAISQKIFQPKIIKVNATLVHCSSVLHCADLGHPHWVASGGT